ncbi:MAG TPA: NAD(P)/FAD-dependent oxidoreductase, partial [Candidatus Norongarragalinales archaeon]|nr:NAD(P)/FAD-dependent oxidoreductase [Candidatus Norongarragalinales archaeon]
MTVYDLVVMGSGPAGGSTALHAAKLGLSVLVLEEHPAAGVPVHCGECLSHVACVRMGWSLPDEVVSRPVDGVRVIFPGNVSSQLTEPGYVLEKHLWEQWIIAQAESMGVSVAWGKKVTQLKRENDSWNISCADGSVFYSRILADATGVAGLASRLLNLNARFKTVIGIQYEMADIPSDGYMDFYIWPDLAPNGYLWMIPKSGGRANVGLVTDQNVLAKTFLDAFVSRMGWTKKTVAKTFGGLIPASGPLP